ncbi:hypothetical protein HQ520_10825 [bacterium]|nr:hypothetical protein [bacterium]
MKLLGLTLRMFLVGGLFALAGLGVSAQNQSGATFLIEAEDFEFPNGWLPQGMAKALGAEMLFVKPLGEGKPVADAMTMIDLPEDGRYHVWTRALDFATYRQGIRRYQVWIDREMLPGEAGQHGHEGYYWEKVGSRRLEVGRHMLGLYDSGQAYARADAVLLTSSDLDPNTLSDEEVLAYKIEPEHIYRPQGPNVPENPEIDPKSDAKVAASIGNEALRIEFVQVRDRDGKAMIAPRMQVRSGEGWTSVDGDGAYAGVKGISPHGKIFLLHTPKTEVSFKYYPNWQRDKKVSVTVRDIEYEVGPSDLDDPFRSGKATLLVPRSCRQVSRNEVEISFSSDTGIEAVGRWSLPGDQPDAADLRVSLELQTPEDGFYSVGFTSPYGWQRDSVRFVQLPPLYQYHRQAEKPRMIMGSITPHPFALVEAPLGDGKETVCVAVCAEPKNIPFQWFTARNGHYGFTLLNEAAEAQPTLFTPVLGLADSEWKKGETRRVAWRYLVRLGDWRSGLEYFSDRVMGVKDYRSPIVSESPASLTDAALNQIDLISNPELCGWDDELKGFWNIEMRRTVSQSTPLALLSAALLARDEYFFTQRALPSIEFALTRPSAHSGLPLALGFEGDEPAKPEKPTEALMIGGPNFGLATWEGVQNMMGGLNPWLIDLLAPDGKYIGAFNRTPTFSELLARYRLNPTPEILAVARDAADAYIDTHVYGTKREALNYALFYNISFYPDWWDLVDLYEITGDTKYRDAVNESAFHTVAGLWSTPPFPQGKVTIHPGGAFEGASGLFYKGNAHFRLGHPRTPFDGVREQEIPAWQISQVGLGVEQPSTYVHDMEEYMWNIQLPPWAPNLLRAWEITGRDIFRTYARNAIIGRFANYSGYGVPGFTNLMFDARYPITGPDLTRFYYHHYPVHLGITLDYLFTQAMARSDGNIRFPHSWQNGYAFFVMRTFGLQPGTIYGETGAVPWLRRDLAEIGGGPDTRTFVDWLAARGKDRFYLILMSQKKETMTVPVSLNGERIGLASGARGRIWSAEGAESATTAFEGDSAWLNGEVELPAMGMVTLSLPAEEQPPVSVIPPLRNGYSRYPIEGPFGDLHAFRFRTPFGKDALYLVFLEGPPEGPSVRFSVENSAFSQARDNRFPYEHTFYPCPMGEDLEVRVEVFSADETRQSVKTILVPGE